MPSMGVLGAMGGAAKGFGTYLNDELKAKRQESLLEKQSEIRRADNEADARMRDEMAQKRQQTANEQALNLEGISQENRLKAQEQAADLKGTFKLMKTDSGTQFWANDQTGQITQISEKDRYIRVAGKVDEYGNRGEESIFDTQTQKLLSQDELRAKDIDPEEIVDAAEPEGGESAIPSFGSDDEAMEYLKQRYANPTPEQLQQAKEAGLIKIGDTSLESDSAPASMDDEISLSDMAAEDEKSGKKYGGGMDTILGEPSRVAGEIASGTVDSVANAVRTTGEQISGAAGAVSDAYSSSAEKANLTIWLDEMTRVKKVPIHKLDPVKLERLASVLDKDSRNYKRVADALQMQQQQQVASR